MKKKLYIAAVFAFGLVLSACNGEPEIEKAEEDNSKSSCFYTYNEGTSNFEWTAFKTSDKVGVKGGFNEIVVESTGSDDPKQC